MAIIINIDVMSAKQKMSVTEPAEKVGIKVLHRLIGFRKHAYLSWCAPGNRPSADARFHRWKSLRLDLIGGEENVLAIHPRWCKPHFVNTHARAEHLAVKR